MLSSASSSKTLQWLSLAAIIWLQSINGTNTDFPAYSSQLKKLLSISQIQLNNLAFASDAGKLFGWLSGVATLYLPLWLVLIIGATLGLIGYGLQFLIFINNKITVLSYSHVYILTVLAGNSVCWINTVCYAITINNFPKNSQTAVGLSTSYSGLSAKIYTDIVDVISSRAPNNRAKDYLLLNSVLPLMVSMACAPLSSSSASSSPSSSSSKRPEMGFLVMFGVAMITGIYAVITTLGLLDMFSPFVHAIILGVLLAAPLVIPFATKFKQALAGNSLGSNKRETRVHHLSLDDEQLGDEENAESGGTQQVSETGSQVIEEIGVKLLLTRVEFWLYFFVYMFGATLGLVYLNNLGQIAESRGHPKTSSLVSLSSSFGFFGRLIPSVLDYYMVSRGKYMVSKPASMAILMTPMAGAFFLLVHSHSIPLYMSTAIIGVCTGAISSLAVTTTTELFGKKNFNVNHNIVVANIPVGSFTFGYLAAVIYTREGAGNGRCMGDGCYRNTFLIWGSICLFGTLLACILHIRTTRKNFT